MTLKKYDVTINGHATTLMLSDEDAKREGLLSETPAKAAPTPANKARKAPNKSS